jgi:hypothetical protein
MCCLEAHLIEEKWFAQAEEGGGGYVNVKK